MEMAWLPLTDYSLKYKMSVSTLRRRIKAEDIHFRFDDGKYFILDEPPTGSPVPPPRAHRPSLKSDPARVNGDSVGSALTSVSLPAQTLRAAELRFDEEDEEELAAEKESNRIKIEQNVLSVANNLLGELKKAYSQILQEKEEQILQLREEVSDLKTLVRVLESENSRLQN